jgi:transposase
VKDVVFLIVLWRLRMKLSLRDLVEILLLRGLVFTHEAVRDWEARLAPLLADGLRKRRAGKAGRCWHLDEMVILSANSRGALQREELSMSLHPDPIGEIPAETARVAHAAFPKGTVAMRLREEFDALYRDEDFQALYPNRGQPALAPWHLALVTIFQFLEHLSDRQAADAVRARIDWKFALGLELTNPGFHFSVLTEFRARLVAGQADHLLLDTMLERFKERGLVKARGRQRTDSTHVLGAVRDLHLLELVGETLRATLDDLAAVVPDWLRARAARLVRALWPPCRGRPPAQEPGKARGAGPRDWRGWVPAARRPGCADRAAGGPRRCDGADDASGLADPLCARRGAAALAARRGTAPGCRPAAVPL